MITISLIGHADVGRRLLTLRKEVGNTEALHKRLGVGGVKWVTDTFRQEGRPRWRPLSPNTVAARRKGSSRILQDKGQLRQSFKWDADKSKSVVGSPEKKALWHQEGTGPYTIRPRSLSGRLAFMTTDGMVFAREVKHPGLVARPMLPTKEQALKDVAIPITDGFVADAIKRAMGGF